MSDRPLDLFLDHLDFADKIACSWKVPGEDVEDLIQTARKALLKAAEKFNPSRKVPFEGFAGNIIRNTLTDTYRKGIRHAEHHPISLDDPIGDEGAIQGDFFQSFDKTPDRIAFENDRRELVENALKSLSDRERCVIVKTFMEEMSGSEIAEELGVSRQAINKTVHQAVSQLKVYLNSINVRESEILGTGKRSPDKPLGMSPKDPATAEPPPVYLPQLLEFFGKLV